MGNDLGNLFYELDNEFCRACLKWQEQEELFSTPENVALLNRTAPAFFGSLQRILFEDVLLQICRLTDPVKTGEQENLSLERLRALITNAALLAKLKLSQRRERQDGVRASAKKQAPRPLRPTDCSRGRNSPFGESPRSEGGPWRNRQPAQRAEVPLWRRPNALRIGDRLVGWHRFANRLPQKSSQGSRGAGCSLARRSISKCTSPGSVMKHVRPIALFLRCH